MNLEFEMIVNVRLLCCMKEEGLHMIEKENIGHCDILFYFFT